MTPLRSRMLEELQLRNLSTQTAHAYVAAAERFARYFNKSPQKLGSEHVREYLVHLIRDNQAMPGTVLANRAALRFVYVCTLKQNWFEDEIPHPKRRLTLPGILSTEEVTRMLDGTHNLKHWSILATFYATALRCSELQHLKVDDLDSKRMVLHVREGKSGPERIEIEQSPALAFAILRSLADRDCGLSHSPNPGAPGHNVPQAAQVDNALTTASSSNSAAEKSRPANPLS